MGEQEPKIGEWMVDEQSGDTFLILKIGEYCIPMSTCSVEAYFDIYYTEHITYHCRRATQKEIEKEAAIMINLEFKESAG